MKYLKSLCLVLLLFALLSECGCTAVIRPTISASEYITSEKKVPTNVAFYATDEFREYSSKHTDVMDMKKWQLELGPAASDALRYAIESRFQKATVRAGEPSFPVDLPAGSLVVVPAFESAEQTGPVVFKFEKYHVAVTMKVRVHDPAGNELKNMTITGKGEKAGAIGYDSAGHSALPEAARLAIKEVADQIVRSLLELAAK